jgi:very-short-patch-repair endonuclease
MNKRIASLTTTRARSLHSNMTDAERLLWLLLRDKQMKGQRFRRQHPIGKYIADFVCIEQKLVIERDGWQHQEQTVYDAQRTACIRSEGWRVPRFWNNEVTGNADGVLSTIAENLVCLPLP